MKNLMVLGLVILGSACSKSENKSEELVYEYELNGCNTGRHSASSKQEYCEKLRDNKLNKGCANNMRKETFEKECASLGIAWETQGSGGGTSQGGGQQSGGTSPDSSASVISCVARITSDGTTLYQGGLSMKFSLPVFTDKEVFSGEGVHVRYLLMSNGSTGTKIVLQLLKETGNLIQEDDFVWDEKNVANYAFKKLNHGTIQVSSVCEVSKAI